MDYRDSETRLRRARGGLMSGIARRARVAQRNADIVTMRQDGIMPAEIGRYIREHYPEDQWIGRAMIHYIIKRHRDKNG